jgi:hypothetical protein
MIEPDEFWITGIYTQRLYQKDDGTVIAGYNYDGNGNRVPMQPTMYWFNAQYFQFDQPSDQAYPYLLTYYQKPADLSVANPTNFLTSRYPRLLRSAIMLNVCEWLKESGQGSFDRTYWAQMAETALMDAQADSDRSKRAIWSNVDLGTIG